MAFQRILVPVDFSSLQDAVLAQAAELARHLDAELHILHCAAPPELSLVAVEPLYVPAEVMSRFTRDQALAVTRKLEEIVTLLPAGLKVSTQLKAMPPTAGILSVADSAECDLIVMGSHGAGLERFLLGSVAEHVSRYAKVPVVVARSTESAGKAHNVVVGIDFSAYSEPLVALATELVPQDCVIHLVHCWQPPHLDTAHLFGDPGHESLYAALSDGLSEHVKALESFADSLPETEHTYSLHVATGRPAAALLDKMSELEAEVVFVGAHDAEQASDILGSVSDRILRHAPTTILLTNASVK